MPETKPHNIPTRSEIKTASNPKLVEYLLFRTKTERRQPVNATTPSTDKSTEPVNITKVIPNAIISVIES